MLIKMLGTYCGWRIDPNSAPSSSGIVRQFPSHVTMTCPFRIASSSALGRREVEPTGETTSRTKTYTTQSDWTFLEVLPCVRPQRSGFLHARVPQAGFSTNLTGSSRACLMSAQRKPRSSRPQVFELRRWTGIRMNSKKQERAIQL